MQLKSWQLVDKPFQGICQRRKIEVIHQATQDTGFEIF